MGALRQVFLKLLPTKGAVEVDHVLHLFSGTPHPLLSAQATKKLPQGQPCGSSHWLAPTTPTGFAFDQAGVISRFRQFWGDSIPSCHLQPTITIRVRSRVFCTSHAPVFQEGDGLPDTRRIGRIRGTFRR